MCFLFETVGLRINTTYSGTFRYILKESSHAVEEPIIVRVFNVKYGLIVRPPLQCLFLQITACVSCARWEMN